jgi:predicted dehydrogenase/nucleoside-diphosphate-sugar epimerase
MPRIVSQPQRPLQTASQPIRLAIVGCGAIVEKVRLPALVGSDEFAVVALVDPVRERAEELACGLAQPAIFADIDQLPNGIEAALIATPNHLHTSLAIRLLERGIHVCVEKPLATNAGDCRRMIEAAKMHGGVLMTALDRRYRPQYVRVRQLVLCGALGAIHQVTIREGAVHNWPSVSGFYTDQVAAGGGVLLDSGIHALDQLLWWFGEPVDLNYSDDSSGGPEAECRLELAFSSGTSALLEFSRLRALGAITEIQSEAGTLRFSPWSPKIEFIPAPGRRETLPDCGTESEPSGAGTNGASGLWQDFANAIREGLPTRATAEDGLQATRLVERCYGVRTQLTLPWRDSLPVAVRGTRLTGVSGLQGRRVLVTGGSGFLGGRIVEKLRFEHGAEVIVLTRAPARAMRCARTGARVFTGNMSDAGAVRAAARGCDVIIHCARDDTPDENQRLQRTLEGTRNVIDAALEFGVDRMIHVSSMVVYERPRGVTLDESCPRQQGHSIYERMKCASEELVLEAIQREDLRAAIVQPTIIYGPHGGWWTRGQLQRLGKRRLVLPEAETGICNLVYVDDAADAILLAAISERVAGQSFLVSGPEPVAWVDFYQALDRMRGNGSGGGVETLPLVELLEKRAGASGQPVRDVEFPDDKFLKELLFPATVDSARARAILGYRPAVDLATGMGWTRLWAQWAGLTSE